MHPVHNHKDRCLMWYRYSTYSLYQERMRVDASCAYKSQLMALSLEKITWFFSSTHNANTVFVIILHN